MINPPSLLERSLRPRRAEIKAELSNFRKNNLQFQTRDIDRIVALNVKINGEKLCDSPHKYCTTCYYHGSVKGQPRQRQAAWE